jgi:hypothetical protein
VQVDLIGIGLAEVADVIGTAAGAGRAVGKLEDIRPAAAIHRINARAADDGVVDQATV